MFERFQLRDWRQFDEVDVVFHDRLTVLTGANGAGKTTILNILGRHFGWTTPLVSTPSLTRRGLRRYFSGIFTRGKPQDEPPEGHQEIGQIHYSEGAPARMTVPFEVSESFNINLAGQQTVAGIYLPSHTPVYSYRKVDQIPTELNARAQLFEHYVQNMRQFHRPQATVESPSYRLKAALISLATFGYGNEAVQRNPEAVETFEGFQEVLRKVLPEDLGFQKLSIRLPDVVLECTSGDFSLDAASGGVAAIVDMSWQVFMKSLIEPARFVVLSDEPENHLHPRLQRSLLPGMLEAFPEAQFIVSTHNPFVVTSVPDSAVYVLDFVDNRVRSELLEEVDRTGSANQILMDVLGVSAPLPLWVEKRIAEVVEQLESAEVSEATLLEAREKLSELGLRAAFPEVVERVDEARRDSTDQD